LRGMTPGFSQLLASPGETDYSRTTAENHVNFVSAEQCREKTHLCRTGPRGASQPWANQVGYTFMLLTCMEREAQQMLR